MPPTDDRLASATTAAGPLATVSCEAARENRKTNQRAGWAAREFAANQRDKAMASHRIWQPLPDLGIRPKFGFSSTEKVFAMGSCFAREVEDALAALGFDVPTRCDDLFSTPLMQAAANAKGVRPRSYLNRYNTMSLHDEVRHLLGLDPALEQGALTYGLDNNTAADLHYTQSLPQVGVLPTIDRRRIVRDHLGARLRDSRVFVFTLGMAECWYDSAAGRYLNNTPGPRVMAAYGDRLEVHMTRFAQHLEAIEKTHAVLTQALGPDIRVIITVSPVPLELSFQEDDVVQTNLYSKSMLRAVAQEFAANHGNVDYFPSYEFVSVASPQTSWAWDYRHVKPGLVEHIMNVFRTHYVTE